MEEMLGDWVLLIGGEDEEAVVLAIAEDEVFP